MPPALEGQRLNSVEIPEKTRNKTTMRVCVPAKPLQSCLTLGPHGLQPARLLCPRDSPGKNTGGGCHALLQGIFLAQGSNLSLI